MKTVYVSNSGNDDGFSPNKPVHSWKRTLKGGDNTIDIRVTGEAAKELRRRSPAARAQFIANLSV